MNAGYLEFDPQRPLRMGELEWYYVDADLAERDHQPWEPVTSRRFSPEFGALLRKRFESFRQLSLGARNELSLRVGAEEAMLTTHNIFGAMSPGVHLKHEPLEDYA